MPLTTTSVVVADDPPMLVVAVHHSVQLTQITLEELKRYLIGQGVFLLNGQRVTIVLPPRGSSPMRWLSESILHMPESAYRRFLLERVFQGSIRPLVDADSIREARDTLLRSPGGISILPVAAIADGLLPIAIVN